MIFLSHLLEDPRMRLLCSVGALLLGAWLAWGVLRFLFQRIVKRIAMRTAWQWDDALFEHGVFDWLARLAPAMVIPFGAGLIPGMSARAERVIDNLATAAMVFFAAMAVSAALSALEQVHRNTPHGRERSLKGPFQLFKLLMFVVAGLIVIGIVTGKQIGLLLSGLGAMSAVLILIFKDTILGFVAGVQLSSNDMLRVGDWITMPGAGADGDVIDITLYTVKVRNFDKTIVTIPTWKLIAESYQNWRGMTESGGRRIKRAIYIDGTSVRFLADDDLARLSRLHLLADYLSGKRSDLERWNSGLGGSAALPANRRRLTNLGTFRAYVEAYLRSHPSVHRQMTCMVRQLDAQSQGIPLELYCFTATTVWSDYENIQADIFDHLFAMLEEFDLRLYQQPSGHDVREGLAAIGARAVDAHPGQEGRSWRAHT